MRNPNLRSKMQNSKLQRGKNKKNETENFRICSGDLPYAHIEVLVTFLLVNFFTKMVITRNPGGVQVPGWVKMNPTGPPELF